MAYFPNGTAGMDFQARQCDRCLHDDPRDGAPGCPVWDAHLLFSYEECNSKSNAKVILDMLIPSADGCAMYREKPGTVDPRQASLFGGG